METIVDAQNVFAYLRALEAADRDPVVMFVMIVAIFAESIFAIVLICMFYEHRDASERTDRELLVDRSSTMRLIAMMSAVAVVSVGIWLGTKGVVDPSAHGVGPELALDAPNDDGARRALRSRACRHVSEAIVDAPEMTGAREALRVHERNHCGDDYLEKLLRLEVERGDGNARRARRLLRGMVGDGGVG